MLPFMGFCLGSGVNLVSALESWWLGFMLYAV
jgi:hypothetical protein